MLSSQNECGVLIGMFYTGMCQKDIVGLQARAQDPLSRRQCLLPRDDFRRQKHQQGRAGGEILDPLPICYTPSLFLLGKMLAFAAPPCSLPEHMWELQPKQSSCLNKGEVIDK